MSAVGGSWLTRLVRLKIFGKSPIGAYLRLNQRLWNNFLRRLPLSVQYAFMVILAHIGSDTRCSGTSF